MFEYNYNRHFCSVELPTLFGFGNYKQQFAMPTFNLYPTIKSDYYANRFNSFMSLYSSDKSSYSLPRRTFTPIFNSKINYNTSYIPQTKFGTLTSSSSQTSYGPTLDFSLNFGTKATRFTPYSFSSTTFGNEYSADEVRVSASASPAKASTVDKTVNYKVGNFDLNYWEANGYDHELGKKMALDAVKHCPNKPDGQCTGYVRETLNRIFGTNYEDGAPRGSQFYERWILKEPKYKNRFRIATKEEIEKHGIPHGSIIGWHGNTPGLTKTDAARKYGHGAVYNDYDGLTYSDCKFGHLDTCCVVIVPIKA